MRNMKIMETVNSRKDYEKVEAHDRFAFPADVHRVTAGRGGEALLICGSDKTALLDCGMAYCGADIAVNIEKVLGDKPLDYILLTHSHYDHIGALPWIREHYPDALVCGSEKCASILSKDSARKLMVELGTEARNQYAPGSDAKIRTDGLHVDKVLSHGESIAIGDRCGVKEEIVAYETRGHTDCSLSFLLLPERLLFTSESTGILEGSDYIHTPFLKSFPDSIDSLKRCMALKPEYICLPHYGMLPKEFNETYFEMFEAECHRKLNLIREMNREGLTEEEMLERYIDRYWTPAKLEEQPFEAFVINSRHIVKALLRAL